MEYQTQLSTLGVLHILSGKLENVLTDVPELVVFCPLSDGITIYGKASEPTQLQPTYWPDDC